MNSEVKINQFILLVQEKQGTNFTFDQQGIIDEYQKQNDHTSTLSIKILTIVGGIMSTLAFLGFLFIAGLYDSSLAMLIFGVGFVLTSVFLNHRFDKLIIDTFSISIYFIGLFLMAFAMVDMNINENLVTLLYFLIALGTIFIMQNFILSFAAVLIMCGSLAVLILSNELFDLMQIYAGLLGILLSFCYLYEAEIITFHKKMSRLHHPIRIGLTFSFLVILGMVSIRDFAPISSGYVWISSILMIVLILYIIHKILNMYEIVDKIETWSAYLSTILILLPTVFCPGLSGAILIILLGFMTNYRTGFVIGIISLIYFISQFYYDMNLTLLDKSLLLMASGVVFIILYLFISKKWPGDERL
ncbi:MAG: DUF4401 domain-containing protein [Saprospiraceae bacterium]